LPRAAGPRRGDGQARRQHPGRPLRRSRCRVRGRPQPRRPRPPGHRAHGLTCVRWRRRAPAAGLPWGVVNLDVSAELKNLDSTLDGIEAVLDVAKLRADVEELSEQAGQPDLWNDQERAQQVTSRLSRAQAQLRQVTDIRRRLDDLPVLYELAEEDAGDEGAK